MAKKNYQIDPIIVGMLFKLEEMEDANHEYQRMQNTIVEISEAVITDFLLKKGVNSEDINKFLRGEFEDNDPKIEMIIKLTSDEELNTQLEDLRNDFLESIFNQLLPDLSEVQRLKLENYTKDYERMQENQRWLFVKSLQAIKKELDTAQAAPSQPGESIQKIEQPEKENIINSQAVAAQAPVSPINPAQIPYVPQIHLGGVKSNPAVQSQLTEAPANPQ